MKKIIGGILGIALSLFGASNNPDTKVISNFDLERYLGRWYEIGRLDHRFERNLSNVTATYSMRDDGKVAVLNRGYNVKKDRWSTARGRARFAGAENEGRLEVSFFGPFYAGYHIIYLSENYDFALVGGDSPNYMWILAREPKLDAATIDKLKDLAKQRGYDLSEYNTVPQDRPQPD